MEQYEEACNYILKTAMLQKEVIRFVMDSIEVPELAALLIGKISRGSELGIRVQLDPGTHLDKEGNMFYGQALVTIVGNLLENAMEALDHYEEENKQITVGIYGGESDILVTVFDNGPGIPEDIREKIFEEGFSTKGTGRGIALLPCGRSPGAMAEISPWILKRDPAHIFTQISGKRGDGTNGISGSAGGG